MFNLTGRQLSSLKLSGKHGINATVRREMGRDIGGACGQLRKSYLEEGEI